MEAKNEVQAARRSRSAPDVLALALWILGLVWYLGIDDPRRRFAEAMCSLVAMGVGWVQLVRAGERNRLGRRVLWILGACALLGRCGAWMSSPAFSEDVYRYVFEGRVVWYEGPGFPFAHSPAEAPRLGVPQALLDASWLRINHPSIATIYPPLSQLVFVVSAGVGELVGGGHLAVLKGLLILADAATWWLVALALRASGRPATLALIFALCPLPILEIGREGHADSLSALGLALGAYGFMSSRFRLGYAGLACSALAKLNGLAVLPVAMRATRRGLWLGLGLLAALAIPWLVAGRAAFDALRSYATRWRSGDGVFSFLLWLAEKVLGGDWAEIGGLTISRHELARAMTAAAFLVTLVAILWSPPAPRSVPGRVGLVLLVLLLLSPSLHPWYVVWVLPFCAVTEGRLRRAGLALATLAPFLHHPGWMELTHGTWMDLPWIRAIVHGTVWLTLLCGSRSCMARAPGLVTSTRPESESPCPSRTTS